MPKKRLHRDTNPGIYWCMDCQFDNSYFEQLDNLITVSEDVQNRSRKFSTTKK